MKPMLVVSAIEVQFRRFANVDKTVDIILRVHPDDATNAFVNEMRDRKNCRFLIEGFRQIPDDEQVIPTKGGSATSDSTTTVGELGPVSSEGMAPDLSTEVESAIETYNRQLTLKNLGWAQKLRNNAQFRGWLFDYCKTPILRNPSESIEWVKQKQHEMMKVDSCAHIYPGSYAESMLKWMSSAFDLDLRNLPIPSRPDEAA